MKFRLVEEMEKPYESFYGAFKVTFPTNADVTTSEIEQMIKDNIYKYTDGEVDDITVYGEVEKDLLSNDFEEIMSESLDEDVDDSKLEDVFNASFDKVSAIASKFNEIAKKRPDLTEDIIKKIDQLIFELDTAKDVIEQN